MDSRAGTHQSLLDVGLHTCKAAENLGGAASTAIRTASTVSRTAGTASGPARLLLVQQSRMTHGCCSLYYAVSLWVLCTEAPADKSDHRATTSDPSLSVTLVCVSDPRHN